MAIGRRGCWSQVRVQVFDFQDGCWFDEVIVAGDEAAVDRAFDARNRVAKQKEAWPVFAFNGERYRSWSHDGCDWYPAICPTCGGVFAVYYPHFAPMADYCSDECRTVAGWMRQADKRREAKPDLRRQCDHCKNWFQPKRATARFCTDKCRVYAAREAKRPTREFP